MVELFEVGIAYLAVAIGGLLAFKLKHSVIPAYILCGMLIGPHGLNLVKDLEFIGDMSTIGVIFLLLFLGLEFSVRSLLRSGKTISIAGTVDLLVNFPLGFMIGLALGWGLLESLFLAGIVYASSSGIVTKALIDLKRLANPETETILGIMIYEDIAIAIFLAVISGVVLAGGDPTGYRIAFSIGKALFFFALVLIVARYFSEHVSKSLEFDSEELFLLFIFSLVVLVSAIARTFGVSEAIGAFLIGLVFAETAQIHQIKTKVIPLRDLFAAMFFFFFGMGIDFHAFGGVIFLVLFALVPSILGKMVSGLAAARMGGMTSRAGISIGAGTIARGEFSLVLAQIGAGFGLLAPFTAAYVLLLSLLGPIFMRNSDNIHAILKKYL